MQFMNSKVLFKTVRHMPRAAQPKPVSIHINYHPGTSCWVVNCWAAMPLILRQAYMQALPAYLLSEKRSCRQFADKHERQNAVMDYYINGNDHALDRFPGGSEPGT